MTDWSDVPCHGYDPFQVEFMLTLCGSCPLTAECQQLAADSPVKFIDPQVWGGLVLPRDLDQLPAREVPAVVPRAVGRPAMFAECGFDPASAGTGRKRSRVVGSVS